MKRQVPQVRSPLMSTPPTVDGTIDAAEWSGAARMEGLVRGGRLLGGGAVGFWFGCDGERLFFAMRSETPPEGQLLMRANPLPQNANVAAAFHDDSVELVLDPVRHDPARRRLYHVIVNAKDAMMTTAYTLDGGGEGWRGDWRTASRIVDNFWEFEASVPLADLDMTADDLMHPMGIRICRNWQRTVEGFSQTEWSPMGGSYLSPETMPVVTWDARAPVTQVLQLTTNDALHVRLSVRNPTADPMDLDVVLRAEPKNSAHSENRTSLSLDPGETEIIELTGPGFPAEEIYTFIQVSASEGGPIYYLRDFRWTMERPEPFFLVNLDEGKALGVEYAYYPSHDIIKAEINLRALADRDKVRAVRLGVREKGSAALLSETTLSDLRDGKGAVEWTIPDLDEGAYELVVSLEGLPIEPEVFEFVRHVFAWERNRLGLSDRLIPPFTPIRVEGRQVSTILREHTLNAVCLPDQVVSLGQPLFKGPTRLQAVVEGTRVDVTGSDFVVEEATETRAVMRSRWTAGTLKGTARAEWDYDGMMLWTLDIEPTGTTVDELTLEVPLDDALMPLMHACTDGLRFNYAGNVPEGEGRVWDGSKAARRSIIGSFVPYLWVGAEERGFSVFGDNDRGWATGTNVPCQELIREDGTLRLRLNLVGTPIRIDEPRRIVIGFQATPVKPMPQNWRRYVLEMSGRVAERHQDTITRIGFMGSCPYWGAEDDAADFYPRNADLSFWKKLGEARASGKVDTEFVDSWMEGYTNILDAFAGADASKRAARQQHFRRHVGAGFNLAAQMKPGDFLDAYTNPRGLRLDIPEGRTFLNEWLIRRFPSRTPRYGSRTWYDADPTQSFRDCLIWYYRKMLTTFVDSIYWDNTFLASSYNTVDTDAYELAPGVIQPSSGLSNMRALIRRTAILVAELDRPILNIAHMTNTGIVPVLSFAQVNFSWEDKVGALDFQERYSREYIRAESIGRQFGNAPIVLWLIHGPDKEKNAWADRTGAGVCLTHEIRPKGGNAYWPVYNRMLDFGYGEPDVAVSTYWQKRHPARVEGSDAVTLVLHKPGAVLVVVSDWGEGGDLALVLDTDSLGLTGKPLRAIDLESDAELEMDQGNRVLFPLKKHDFKAILIHARDEASGAVEAGR